MYTQIVKKQINNTQSVNLILDRLKSALKIDTDTQLALALGVKTNTLANWKSRGSINFEPIFTVCEQKGLDLNCIIYGDGNKIAPNVAPNIAPNDNYQPDLSLPKIITIDRATSKETTLFITAKAAAGYLGGHEDYEYIKNLPTIDLPGLSGQTHRAFEVRGQSMPPHHSGSIAIGRFVESFNDIKDRRVYIVVTKYDGIVLKRVINRIKEENKLILISDNENKRDYPTSVVSPEDVVELWYWRASIIRESPEPGNVYNRINDIDGRLSIVEHLLKGK